MERLGLRTQFEFELPMGYVDEDGRLHRRGEMRLATARDEIEPLRDPRVAQNDAYLTVLVLARVITRVGDIVDVTPSVIENLFAADLAYLQDFYGIANFGDQSELPLHFDEPEENHISDTSMHDDLVVDEEAAGVAPTATVEEVLHPRRPMVEEIEQPLQPVEV